MKVKPAKLDAQVPHGFSSVRDVKAWETAHVSTVLGSLLCGEHHKKMTWNRVSWNVVLLLPYFCVPQIAKLLGF